MMLAALERAMWAHRHKAIFTLKSQLGVHRTRRLQKMRAFGLSGFTTANSGRFGKAEAESHELSSSAEAGKVVREEAGAALPRGVAYHNVKPSGPARSELRRSRGGALGEGGVPVPRRVV